ncbi:ATP-dependent protease [Sporosarcina sp. P16b]|uniref:Lon protease family protein n=1 Tax=Sporosarcina sp. P16b TaxID=2048261 RepID=UPI000C16C204|nr:ATP-binding protein [Sporosarcina sp. P16b]PIC69869.1 ATP-dependent protease [Sporosarcina sp. P16b]
MANYHDSFSKTKAELRPEQLKKIVDYSSLPFDSTEHVEKLTNIVGQKRARSVMNFGLHVNKPGYNLYVAGIEGVGKTSFVNTVVHDFSEKEATLFDWCYVNNFEDEYKPKVLRLPVGLGKQLQKSMEDLLKDLQVDIPTAFNEENRLKNRSSIIRKYKDQVDQVYKRTNEIAAENGFLLKQSDSTVATIPMGEDGNPISEEAYKKLTEEQRAAIESNSVKLQEIILEATESILRFEQDLKKSLAGFDHQTAITTIDFHIDEVKKIYKDCPEVIHYIKAVRKDLKNNFQIFLSTPTTKEDKQLGRLFNDENQALKKYTINVLVDHSETTGMPVISADNPTFYNLMGKVEYENRMGVMSTDFTKIKPGYLHNANGGYLLIQAKDIFSKSQAWEGLKRALLIHKLQIENIGEHASVIATASVNPDPIQLDVKVIIIGNMDIYQALYHHDEDFRKLFKIRVDFDVEMKYNQENIAGLVSFIHTHGKKYGLRHFDSSAVAKIIEYSSRVAGDQYKLSTRFNLQVELLYEADAWAGIMGDDLVTAKHIEKAIQEKRYRSNLYEEKIQASIDEGSILIDTTGEKIGQVNGLAVYDLGQYHFGKPSRITATTFMGKKGFVNIERESQMSGNTHNKGVYILGGYLGQKFAQKYPLVLTAHIAFEQSYGGVDGDSASSTELYAILSSLAEIPIHQGLAVTGSVNQNGEIQPIGGVNEKIEGFYNVCKNKGLTGKQGVLIPHQNVKNLMLNDEVIESVRDGQFHIYKVRTIEEGIEILTGIPAGHPNEQGDYDRETVYGKAATKLRMFMEFAREQER